MYDSGRDMSRCHTFMSWLTLILVIVGMILQITGISDLVEAEEIEDRDERREAKISAGRAVVDALWWYFFAFLGSIVTRILKGYMEKFEAKMEGLDETGS